MVSRIRWFAKQDTKQTYVEFQFLIIVMSLLHFQTSD